MDALTTEGYAGKRQVPTLEQQRLTAGLGGSCRDGFEAFEGFSGFGAWQTTGLNTLRTEGYVQANGRLQRWNSTGLRPQGSALGMNALTTEGYAGKRQVPTLEQQGQRLCARKRQVATLEQHRLMATGLGGTALGGSCRDGFEAF